jgi:hypothetical protein
MTERQWELYRRSVVETMPDSDYRTAVLTGITHRLMMLDWIEASQSSFRQSQDFRGARVS